MNFSDLDSIVSQEVVENKLEIIIPCEESQNLSIVVQELLLGGNSTTTKLLLQELKELLVLLWWNRFQGVDEAVLWACACLWLLLTNIFEKFSGIFIAVINSNRSTTDSNVEANGKVLWLEWHLGSVLLEDHLPLEESALWCSTVDHLWLSDHDRSVFEEIVDDKLSNSVVFKSALNYTLFEVTEKSQYLFVKLDEGGLKQFVEVPLLHVAGVLHLAETLVHFTLIFHEISLDCPR